MKKYDAIIIGSGMGGRTVATDLARAGKQVLLVEKRAEMLGGVYLNEGGIPANALAFKAQYSAQRDGMFIEQTAGYRTAIQDKDILIASLRETCCDALGRTDNITVQIGTASLAGEHLVRIENEQGDVTVQGDKIFINTGAVPIIPDIRGIRESRYVYTSSTIFRLKELPKRMIVIGGGYLGLEFASIYSHFGSSVTIVEKQENFLPNEDEEIATAVKDSFLKRKIGLLLASTVIKIEDVRGCALLTIQTPAGEELLYADAVLIAAGRKPNVAELNLRSAGVELSRTGGIRVDEYLRTTAPDIWALGDVTGEEQFQAISLDDARIIRSQLLGDKKRTLNNRGQFPYCVSVSPAFARIGLTEKEARGRGFSVKIARMKSEESSQSRIIGVRWGLLKAVVDANTNQILGVHLFSAMAHETTNLAKAVMDAGVPYTALRDGIFTHPSMTEAFNGLFEHLE